MRRMGRSVLPWSSTIPSGFHQPSSSFPTTARWELDPGYRVPPVTALAAMGNTNVILSVLVDP